MFIFKRNPDNWQSKCQCHFLKECMGIHKGKPIAWHLGSCTLQEDKKRQLSPCLTTYKVLGSQRLESISPGN